VVSAKDPYGHILGFLDQFFTTLIELIFFSISLVDVLLHFILRKGLYDILDK
jgi:hypothetical protein